MSHGPLVVAAAASSNGYCCCLSAAFLDLCGFAAAAVAVSEWIDGETPVSVLMAREAAAIRKPPRSRTKDQRAQAALQLEAAAVAANERQAALAEAATPTDAAAARNMEVNEPSTEETLQQQREDAETQQQQQQQQQGENKQQQQWEQLTGLPEFDFLKALSRIATDWQQRAQR